MVACNHEPERLRVKRRMARELARLTSESMPAAVNEAIREGLDKGADFKHPDVEAAEYDAFLTASLPVV